jgi:hypothetical protein
VVGGGGGGGGDSGHGNGGGGGDDGEDCNTVMGDHYLHWERLPQRRHFAIVAHVLDRQRVSCRHDVRLLVAAEVTVVLRSTCAVQDGQWRTRDNVAETDVQDGDGTEWLTSEYRIAMRGHASDAVAECGRCELGRACMERKESEGGTTREEIHR